MVDNKPRGSSIVCYYRQQIKSQRTKLAVDSINFGRPMRNQKVLAAATQGLNELLDASTVMLARIAAAEVIARIFGPPAPRSTIKTRRYRAMLPRHSDKETDDGTPTWKLTSQNTQQHNLQCQKLLNDYRAQGPLLPYSQCWTTS